METEKLKFDQWAILEIMGHQRYAGRVTEETIGGCAFIRLDVPASPGQVPFTKYFGASSIYALTPVAEDLARGIAAKLQNETVSVYDLPPEMRAKLRSSAPAIAAPRDAYDYDDEDDHHEDGDEDEHY